MRCRLAVLPVAMLAGVPLALGRAQEPPARPAAVLLTPRFAASPSENIFKPFSVRTTIELPDTL